MTTNDYFEKELNVQFTMNELYQIASALADESFSESANGREGTADVAWKLRDKVKSFISIYK